MMGPVRWLTWAFLRFLVWLRYRVTIKGLPAQAAGPGPFLILPNHPAYADPASVLVRLWPRFRMRPLLLETNFRNPVLGPVRLAAPRHPRAGHGAGQRGGPAARRRPPWRLRSRR